MNKIYISILFFAIIGSNYSFADCITGYACSINSLQAKNNQLEEQFIKELNIYDKMRTKEDFISGNKKDKIKYNDFFPYTYNILNIEYSKK